MVRVQLENSFPISEYRSRSRSAERLRDRDRSERYRRHDRHDRYWDDTDQLCHTSVGVSPEQIARWIQRSYFVLKVSLCWDSECLKAAYGGSESFVTILFVVMFSQSVMVNLHLFLGVAVMHCFSSALLFFWRTWGMMSSTGRLSMFAEESLFLGMV